jgi:hypothetical protein
VPLGFRGDATREAQGLRAGAYEMCCRVVCKFIRGLLPCGSAQNIYSGAAVKRILA